MVPLVVPGVCRVALSGVFRVVFPVVQWVVGEAVLSVVYGAVPVAFWAVFVLEAQFPPYCVRDNGSELGDAIRESGVLLLHFFEL